MILKTYLNFANNTASQGGSVIYGGLLDRCEVKSNRADHLGIGIDVIKEISQYGHTPLAITSDPLKICLCSENNTIDCNKREIFFTTMSGQTMEFNGTVASRSRW